MSMLPIEISKEDQIAIVAPHPDDEVIGTGGLLLSYPSQCTVILMTDGRHGDSNVEPRALRIRRYEEFAAVINKIGARSIHLDYEDGTLLGESKCFDLIDFTDYSKIFLPCADDNHPDHMAACIYAKKRILEQNILKAEVYEYEVHLPIHKVSHYIDISSVIHEKMALISMYKSQMDIHDYPNQICALASYRGFQNNQGGRALEAYAITVLSGNLTENREIEQERRIEKMVRLNRILSKWVESSAKGLKLGKYVYEEGMKCIAIYGWGDLGKKLYSELVTCKVYTAYVLDKNISQSGITGLEVYYPRNKIGYVDAVIVTVLEEFGEIKSFLEKLGYRNIYSLDDILDSILFSIDRRSKSK